MRTALAGNEIMPDAIKSTDWGKIFIAYSPVYQNETVIGVVGVEFDADGTHTLRYLPDAMAPRW